MHLALAGMHFDYCIDHMRCLQCQQTLLSWMQYPRPAYVGVDLSQCSLQQALLGTGFEPAVPSLFLCEGLIYYLREASFLYRA